MKLTDGTKTQLVAIYSGLPVPELQQLLLSVFGESCREAIGFEGDDGTAIPITVACQHPENLTAEQYLILSESVGNGKTGLPLKTSCDLDYNFTGKQPSKISMIVDSMVSFSAEKKMSF